MEYTGKIFLIALLSIFCAKAFAQEEILLYPKGAAESNGLEENTEQDGEVLGCASKMQILTIGQSNCKNE